MKKFLFLFVLAVMFTACDTVERKSSGDYRLTLVHNVDKDLYGLELGRKTLLETEYDSITLPEIADDLTIIVAEKGGKQTLYGFASIKAIGQMMFDEVVTAEKISVTKIHEISNYSILCIAEIGKVKHVYLPVFSYDVGNESFTWKELGPFDDICHYYNVAITKKNNLYGAISFWGKELKPQFEEFYVETGRFGISCIIKKVGENRYTVGNLSPFRDDGFLVCGYLSMAGFAELKSAGKVEGNGCILNFDDIHKDLFWKHVDSFGGF